MNSTVKAPWHLWIVGLLTLAWNAIGGWGFTTTYFGDLAALGMTADQIAYFENFPIWASVCWALGVWGAIAGSLLLLLRSRWAVHAFAFSVIGLIGTVIYQDILTEVPDGLQNTGLAISIRVIAVLVLLYTVRLRRNGVLR